MHATHAAYFKSKIIDIWELEDIWRIQNPWTKKFTHFYSDDKNFLRLDYCLVSSNFAHLIKDCVLCPCVLRPAYGLDHTPLYIRVHFPGEPIRKRFNFPVDLCFSDQFRLQLCQNLERL